MSVRDDLRAATDAAVALANAAAWVRSTQPTHRGAVSPSAYRKQLRVIAALSRVALADLQHAKRDAVQAARAARAAKQQAWQARQVAQVRRAERAFADRAYAKFRAGLVEE